MLGEALAASLGCSLCPLTSSFLLRGPGGPSSSTGPRTRVCHSAGCVQSSVMVQQPGSDELHSYSGGGLLEWGLMERTPVLPTPEVSVVRMNHV